VATWVGATALILALVAAGVLALNGLRATSPPPVVTSAVPELIVAGPRGPVTLHDWPDGRTWVSFWRSNRDWTGAPLFADRPFQEQASCAGFVYTIVCLALDSPTTGYWKLAPVLLGTQAMRRDNFLPVSHAQPAELLNRYLLNLKAQGADIWYRFGALQSPPITVGDVTIEYYQRARFSWPTHSHDVRDITIAPLGQIAVDQGW
jgi:hypothetical protein